MIHRRLNSDARRTPASRKIVAALLAVTGLALPGAASGQASQDSLLARLRRAEAAIATLQQQVAEQAESGVKTADGSKVTLSWRVALNAFGNSRRANNVDNPQFALADVPSGIGKRGGGMTMRHTRFVLSMNGGEVLGANATGSIDVDFYGGQVPSSGGRHFPLIRLRTASAILWWSRAELLVGQESPLVSMLNPETPAAIGTPLFAASGNLWLWLPQVRMTLYNSETKRFGIQGAVLAPASGDAAAPHDTDHDIAERSSRPFIQGRAFARFGEERERSSEIGCGAHRGWLMPVTELKSTSAIACDLKLVLADIGDVRGEVFSGSALRGLGGGGIGQHFVGTPVADQPVETTGGWMQLNLSPAGRMRLGAGCGVDHPDNAALRLRNDACAAYVVQPMGPLQLGAEFRRLRTEYATGRYTNDHVTVTVAWGF